MLSPGRPLVVVETSMSVLRVCRSWPAGLCARRMRGSCLGSRVLGTSRAPASSKPSEVLRYTHAFGVQRPQLAHLELRQSRPAPKERGEKLVAEGPLVDQIICLHRCEVVRKLLHSRDIPGRCSTETPVQDFSSTSG